MEILPDEADVTKLVLDQTKGSVFGSIATAHSTLRQIQPDVFVTYNWGAIEWAAANLLLGFKHVHIEDGFRPDEIETRKFRRNFFRWLVLRRNCKIVVVSETLKRIALEEWRLSPDRVFFVPNGIDIDKFDAPKRPLSRQDLGIGDDQLVVGTIAALRPEKNLEALLRAFAQLSNNLNAKLLIVGDGPEMEKLKSHANSLDISEKVHFLGHTDTPDAIYSVFDIFALSSATEQMPLSVIEAMSARLPVAAYEVGDVALMVAANNRKYIVNNTEESLTWAMEELGRNSDQRRIVGEANHEKALQDYAQNKMVETYLQLFS